MTHHVDPQWLARLRETLAYDPETGEFRWLKFRGSTAKAGSIAGTLDSKGHRQIRFEMRLYGAHRLAWLMTHSKWPEAEIDHINRVRSDNRLINLRECSHADNSKNRNLYASNSSGVAGVSWYPKYGKWVAHIRAGDKRTHLGYFAEFDDAVAARRQAEELHFAEFGARHGVQFNEPQEQAA